MTEPATGDAFGETLLACWRNGAKLGASFEIVERDDGFVGAADAARYFSEPDEWAADVRWAFAQVDGRVLDIGGGAGQHAVPLSKAGFDVVAVDPSPGAVEIMKERGVTATRAALPTLPDDLGGYDTILLLGGNLALLGDADRAASTLRALADIARPGARIIGGGIDPTATESPDHGRYHDLNRERGRLAGHLRIRVRHRRLATPWFDYVFRSPDELADAVADSPWTLTDVMRDGPNYCARIDLA